MIKGFRKFAFFPFLTSSETETQVNGITLIIDQREYYYSSSMKFPISRLFSGFKITKNGPLWIKQTICIGIAIGQFMKQQSRLIPAKWCQK